VILGIDEVGRGPWAGPLVVGAVILGEKFQNPQISDFKQIKKLTTDAPLNDKIAYTWQHLTDSKKLTVKARTELNDLILELATAHGLGWVSAKEVDKYGLTRSLMLATRRAVKQILAQKTKFDHIVIDGTINFLRDTPLESHVTTLKKADLTIKEVSAASIIAKVARDEYMAKIAFQYPTYGFEKHVGYGTALHREALLKQGICPEHRQSFRPIKEIIAQFTAKCPESYLGDDSELFLAKPLSRGSSDFNRVKSASDASNSQKGQTAELAVADYLQAQDHQIIAHNFRTKTYEIDLISTKEQQIFFTEVKYSQNLEQEGTALVRITAQKIKQMTYAAQAFMAKHPEFKNLQPILAVASVHGTKFQVEDWFILE